MMLTYQKKQAFHHDDCLRSERKGKTHYWQSSQQKQRWSTHDDTSLETKVYLIVVLSLICLGDLCIWPLILLTDRRDPALALATDSFSFSAARRWTAWKLFRAAEKSFISRSFWIFCCLWTPPRKAKQMVWHQLETQGGIHDESQMSNGRNNEWHNNLLRESIAILFVSVYIPPTPNNNGIEVRNSVNFILPSVSNKQPIQMDFNHAGLKNVLPDIEQQVVFPTKGKQHTRPGLYNPQKEHARLFPCLISASLTTSPAPFSLPFESSDPEPILRILLCVKVLDAPRGEISFWLWCGYVFVKN